MFVLPDFVVGVEHLGRLHEYGLSRGRFVEYEAAKPSLMFGEYGDNDAAFAYRRQRPFGHPFFSDSPGEELLRKTSQPRLLVAQALSDAGELRRGVVAYPGAFIDVLMNFCRHHGDLGNRVSQRVKRRAPFFRALQECFAHLYRLERASDIQEFLFVQVVAGREYLWTPLFRVVEV